jgi:endonuclease/exonuclease/phosphatase family metal-dependent hydrolase
MNTFLRKLFVLLAGMAALTCLLALPALAGEAKGKEGRAGHLKVMTQNLYVGANLFKILNPENSVPENAAEIFGDILETDFWQRAEAIADLVAEHEPHLIGLQEVSLIQTQCPTDILPPPGNPAPNATDLYADYLAILQAALSARGLDYHIAAEVTNADVELPVENDGLLESCPYPYFDARLTDRDVTLRRGDVNVEFSYSDNYTFNLPVPTAAGEITFVRGFNIVDIDLKGRGYRFVNTHLEVSGDPFANFFQTVQSVELTQILDGLADGVSDEIIVVVGDLNSDPGDGPVWECAAPPDFSCPTPYSVMAANGYVDAWMLRNGAPDPGYTCCQEDLLTNGDSWLDQRIDHIWVRPPTEGAQGPHFLNAVHATVVGNRQEDRTVDGLWPSDHAGVVAGMTFRHKK